MNISEAYDQWANQYDTNKNKTRDLEGAALRHNMTLLSQQGFVFKNALELGCGTGKNTSFLVEHFESVTAVDFSDGMLNEARNKIQSPRVQFLKQDLNEWWNLPPLPYNWVGLSLVLEHLQSIGTIFNKIDAVLTPGGIVYVGELHPFKQYSGTQARYQTEEGVQLVECFQHHVSEYLQAALQLNWELLHCQEFFDQDTYSTENPQNQPPRILTFLFKKKLL